MVKKFFRKILCLALNLSILISQVVYASELSFPLVPINPPVTPTILTAVQSSPVDLLQNKRHFEANQSTGDKFQIIGRGEFTVNDPLNRVTTYNYDNNENLASVVDAGNKTTGYVYDERDLLFAVTDANTPAGVTTYDYDLNGNLAKITDANGNPTTYTYDLFDRLDITQYANLSSSNFDYDKNSNLTRHTTPSGKPVDYVYDALNRLTAKNFPLTPALNTTYAYDLGGRLIDADNTAADIHFTHDALNRTANVTQTINSLPFTINYAYDKSGNRTQLVYPGGKTLDYVYDANDRLTSIEQNTLNFLQYQYDPLDRRINKSYLSASLPLASYSYDLANQLASVTNTLVNGTPVSQYAYPAYDNVGNRKQLDRTLQTQPTQSTQYNYNDIYELISVSGAQNNSYDYDNVGNRELADGVAYTPNNLNQYTNVGGTSYLYDGNGNLTSNGTNTYAYDELNRLSTFSNGVTNANYQYDAFNRRVSKTVNGTTTYFIYDDSSVIAEYDGTGALNAEYVLGDQVDEILTMERGGSTYYYFYDGLGSVAEVTDSTGAVVENYTYDPFGNPSVINSAIGNPYRFTGQEFDEESGFHHFNARTYNSLIGRFQQRDPLGYIDGMNFYSYVNNNSINLKDPTGEAIDIVADIGFIGYDLYRLASDSLKGCKGNLKGNLAALGGDVLGALIPGLTGVGLGIRSVEHTGAVIGKLKDLQKLKKGEHTLLPHFKNKGSPKLNWKNNSTVLRTEMRKGNPIRDASVDSKAGALRDDTGFLQAERNLLRNQGWRFNPDTGYWHPPK